MSYQFNDQLAAYTHQFAAVAARVNRLALENAETVFGVQLRTFEKNVDATTSYLGELADARDLEAYKTLLPKALQVARDNAERVAAAGQEVFGLRDTPRIAGGRVPVVLHLLGPNMRPQQITDDLASFWANIYPQVRKELRRRYPKHAWPDDPLTAAPEAKGRRRG